MSNDQPVPDILGHYGRFGGRFAPEALFAALDEVTTEWDKARQDPAFQTELDRLLKEYTGRPSPLNHPFVASMRHTQTCRQQTRGRVEPGRILEGMGKIPSVRWRPVLVALFRVFHQRPRRQLA